MSTVQDQIDIDAPIELVWETVMDPNRFPDWVTIHRSVSGVSADKQTRGARMDQELCMRGMNFTVHWTLDEVDIPRLAVWKGDGPAKSQAVTRYELTEGRDGKPTHFDYFNEFSTPGGRLGALAGRLIVGAASAREAKNSLQRLKALCERS